eukprot:2795957-Rhodomonas_salina.2
MYVMPQMYGPCCCYYCKRAVLGIVVFRPRLNLKQSYSCEEAKTRKPREGGQPSTSLMPSHCHNFKHRSAHCSLAHTPISQLPAISRDLRNWFGSLLYYY